MGGEIRIKRNDLEKFCTDVFFKLGLSEAEAADSAEILVAADARGIASHGVGRLWRYENGLKKGIMAGGGTARDPARAAEIPGAGRPGGRGALREQGPHGEGDR